MRTKPRPEQIFVHPKFKTILKTKSAMENKSMIDCSEELAIEVEKVLRGRGLISDKEEEREHEKRKRDYSLFF